MSQKLISKRLVKKDGTIAYTWEGKLHNWEGPALIPEGNNKKAEYYLFGIKYTKQQWEERKKDTNGIPFHKTAASRQMGNRL